MSGVLLDMAISLDGAISGPDGADVGLYDWYFDPTPVSRPVVDELVATTGAIVMGRGVWGEGWDESPYDAPHFVVTHRPLAPVPGGAVDAVAVEGVRTAVERAREAAGDRWVTVGGGPDVARQCLAEGLVDELQLHVVPIVAGGGRPLFAASGPALRLTKLRVVDAPNVTHVRYRVER
jgi:dihydrofolate reductase